MTLNFSTIWPDKMGDLAGMPTYFMEKIIAGQLLLEDELDYDSDRMLEAILYGEKYYGLRDPADFISIPKLHTIREDKSDRWKEGNKIHFVINNRTKDRFQFAPVMRCTGVQKIEIKNYGDMVHVFIDGKWMKIEDIIELALNDGFDSVEDFFKWFDKDFTGKIIHWTNERY